MKKDKFDSHEEIEETEEYIMPADCEQSEQEIEQISEEESKAHYTLINLFVIVIIAVFVSAAFLLLTGEKRAMKIDNPLNFKTFISGKFSKNLQESYEKALPYPYSFKNANEKITFFYGVGNKIEKFKDDNDGLVLVSDEEIEQKKISIKKNEEKALMTEDEEQDIQPEKTKKKTTAKKKTETGAQRGTTTTRRTSASKTTTTEETTSLTTTNNDPPVVTITTTVPPSVTYDYGDGGDIESDENQEDN